MLGKPRTTKIAALIFLASLCACQKPPQETQKISGSDFQVEKLFTYDGCTVYRFTDDRTVYYTNCSSTAWEHSCGKGCTAHDEVKTGHE